MFFRTLGAKLIALAELCPQLKGTQAKAIHKHFTFNAARVEAGDQSLHDQINENGKRIDRAAADGNGVAKELQKVRVDAAGAIDSTEAEKWNQTRAIEGLLKLY